jgi:hypothetical protein
VNPKTMECMTSISSEQVFHQALRMVRDSSQASTSPQEKDAVLRGKRASGLDG